MRRSLLHLSIPATFILATVVAPAVADEGSSQSLHEIEVIEENQFRLEVEKTEMEFDPTTSAIDDGGTEVEQLIFEYTPVASFNPWLYDTERVECPLIPDFAARAVTSAPVAVFRTDFDGGSDIKRWNLDITDYRGEVFYSMDGKDTPPSELPWNGLGKHKEVLKPGFPYSFIFMIEDSGTNKYQYAGNTFSLPFLSYKEGKNLRVEAAGHSLFQKNSVKSLPGAEKEIDRILRELLDSPQQAVQVEVWSEKLALAQGRADWLASELEERLLLADDQISAEAYQFKGDPPGRDGLCRVTLLKSGKR
ncbi:MAG: hypothetical protein GY835_17830 [bacterium]|nr:hypothetical protein [bacterium]